MLAASLLAPPLHARAEPGGEPTAPVAQDYGALISHAVAAFSAGRHLEARGLFEQAHMQIPSARTLRGLGITAVALKRFALGKRELEGSLAHPRSPLTAAQQREVRELLTWLGDNLTAVRLEVTPSHAAIRIDGERADGLEVLLEPGPHRLQASAPGFRAEERAFELARGAPLELRIDLANAPALQASAVQAPGTEPPPARLRAAPAEHPALWPWLGGSGLVLLVTGGALLVAGLNDIERVENARRGTRLSSIESAHDRAPWLTGIGIGLGTVGIAGVGAAALLLALDDPAEQRAWSLAAGPGWVAMKGRF